MPLVRAQNAGQLIRDAVVLDLGDLRRQGEAIVQAARDRAAGIVAEGQAERARLIASAAAEGRAEGLAEGLARGHAEGSERGYAAALQERREALAGIERAWTEALGAFVAEREAMLADARRNILALACTMGEKVTRRTLELAPAEVVSGQLEAVLSLVMRPTRLVLEVNPQDCELVRAALPGVLAMQVPGEGAALSGSPGHVVVVGRERLPRGSMVAKLGSGDEEGAPGESAGAAGGIGGIGGGEIDASLHTQLARIVETLLPPRGGGADPADGGDPSGRAGGAPAPGRPPAGGAGGGGAAEGRA